jgi:hypothetical protein
MSFRHTVRRGRTLAAILATSAALAAAEQPPEYELERLQWTGESAPGAQLEVVNRFGDLRARFGGYDGAVEVHAVLQQFAAEGPRLVLDTASGGAATRIEVGFRDGEGRTWRTAPVAGHRQRADLVVFVPRGVRLLARTGAGLLEARGLHGDLEARTDSGDLMVRSIHGDLALSTDSGAITAALARRDSAQPQRLRSARGAITLSLAEDGDFTVRATTRAPFVTDFSLRIEEMPRAPGLRQAEARIGKGTTPVEVASGHGPVRLVLRPAAALSRAPAPGARR